MITMAASNKSLDASGGSVFLNLLDAAKGAFIRAAASTQPLCCFNCCQLKFHEDQSSEALQECTKESDLDAHWRLYCFHFSGCHNTRQQLVLTLRSNFPQSLNVLFRYG